MHRPLLVLVAAVVVAAGAGCGDAEPVASDVSETSDTSTTAGGAPPAVEDDAPELSEEEVASACADATPETQCGLTFEELRDLNMRYADRSEFVGDAADAAVVIGVVRQRLEPFVGVASTPTEEELYEALDGLAYPQVSASAVGANGMGFAVALEGGCVFGSIFEGELIIEYGGHINDGGCLAIYGH